MQRYFKRKRVNLVCWSEKVDTKETVQLEDLFFGGRGYITIFHTVWFLDYVPTPVIFCYTYLGVTSFASLSSIAVSHGQRCARWCMLGTFLLVRWTQWKDSGCDRLWSMPATCGTPYVSLFMNCLWLFKILRPKEKELKGTS